jgi:hypothetical protein
MKTVRHIVWRIARFFLLFYVCLALFGCVMADRLIFQPPPSSYGIKMAGLLQVSATDGTSLAVLYLPNPSAKHTLFFFHGNAEDLGDEAPVLRSWQAIGFAVLAFDYRGYGLSGGHPSEGKINADTQTVLAYAEAHFGVVPARSIVVGRSVGSGPAVELAVNVPVAGLVLISPFTSAFRVVTRVKVLPFDRFDNLAKIDRLRCPLLVIHGTVDSVIPFSHGEALFAAAPEPKRHVWIEGANHNDIFALAGDRIAKELLDFENSLPPVR